MKIIVYVKPNAKYDEVRQLNEKEYGVAISKPALDGKANLQLIKILSKEFKVPQKNILIKNPRSRKKVVEVKGKN